MKKLFNLLTLIAVLATLVTPALAQQQSGRPPLAFQSASSEFVGPCRTNADCPINSPYCYNNACVNGVPSCRTYDVNSDGQSGERCSNDGADCGIPSNKDGVVEIIEGTCSTSRYLDPIGAFQDKIVVINECTCHPKRSKDISKQYSAN